MAAYCTICALRHQVSIVAALAVLALVMTGSAVTSAREHPSSGMPVVYQGVHRYATAGVLLVAGFVVAQCHGSRWTGLSWALLIGIAAEGALGFFPMGVMVHAILAAMLFAASALLALATSATWQRDPDFVQDYGWPSLRSLSTFAALLVVVQMGFGAAIRHLSTGVLWHLLGALVVAVLIIIVGVFTTNQFPKHPMLRPLAIWLMVISGVQIFLGMTAFLMRMMSATGTKVGLLSTVAHVTNGSLTFAAAVLLAAEIRRSVRPRAAAE